MSTHHVRPPLTPHVSHPDLPAGVHLLERGWLSSNNVLLVSEHESVLIDSGYVSHAEQTLQLVQSHLGQRPLDRLLNTHLHSDHCGGNARLQAHYPKLHTAIAPGEAQWVMPWQAEHLSHESTGQQCEPFTYNSLLQPGATLELAGRQWQVLAAPGHDPHAIVLWCEAEGVLLSADALWENGFGIVFPELVGEPGFADVRASLDMIEALGARVVLPGHGRVITDVAQALQRARTRIAQFEQHPSSHHQHAIKALLKFLLLDWKSCTWQRLCDWVAQAPIIHRAMQLGLARGYAPAAQPSPWHCANDMQRWLSHAVLSLQAQAQLHVEGEWISNP